jgi:uncharacterized protein (TIGR03083 family)
MADNPTNSVAAAYRDGRNRVLALASELAAAQAATPVAACPGWTVKDTYAHLAGVSADALSGNLDGIGTPPWTDAQVSARSGRTLSEVCQEWAGNGPLLDARLEDGGRPQIVFDVWSHEQDIRSAVGRPGGRDGPQVRLALDVGLPMFDQGWRSAGRPPLLIRHDARVTTLGQGTPEVTLEISEFELLRMLMGRRSRAQMLAYDWDGDPEPLVDHLHIFPLPPSDLVE